MKTDQPLISSENALKVLQSRYLLHHNGAVETPSSKTINLPENASVIDVERIYKSAWQKKTKGITIYRYKSKKNQVMHRGIRPATEACKVCPR